MAAVRVAAVRATAVTGGREAFAFRWAHAVAGASYVPMTVGELATFLRGLTDLLADALLATDFSSAAGYTVGAALVEAHFTGPEPIGRSIELLGTLPAGLGRVNGHAFEPEEILDRVTGLQAALAAGYAQALRVRILGEQESVRTAALVARSQAEQALQASEARFRAVFTGAATGIAIGDTAGRVLDANPALVAMLGYEVEELRSRKFTDFVHPEDLAAVWPVVCDGLLAGDRDEVELEQRFLRRARVSPLSGNTEEIVWLHVTISLVRDDEDIPSYLVAMAQDVTERHELHRRLRHQALHDPLTGLANRALFLDRVAEVFDGSRAGSGSGSGVGAGSGASAGSVRPVDRVGLCLLDVDGFTAVNDSLGHQVADRILVAVADRLAGCVTAPDQLVARIGGDEFAVLVPGSTGSGELTGLAESMLAALAGPIAVDGHQLALSASVGVVERPVPSGGDSGSGDSDGGAGPAGLVRAANVTLRWAKTEGRHSWLLFDADRYAEEVTRHTLSATFPDAIARNEFVVEYQPLVRLTDGSLRGVEALVRWQHPRLGRLGPDQFIQLAEETGAIVPLGRAVLAEACRQASSWQDLPGFPPFVSVNLAVRQCRDPHLVTDVARVLAETGLPPHRLQLEVTESALLGPGSQPLAALQELSALGIRIAIDDFGTGYSNLVYLQRLPVHELKLAGAFVEGLRSTADSDPAGERIVAAVVSLAHGLGLTVTAEGVETAEQAERLQLVGCDLGQGWLFARPASAAAITDLLRSGAPLGPPRPDQTR